MDYSKYKYVGVRCDTEEEWDKVYESIGNKNKIIFAPNKYIVIKAFDSYDIGCYFTQSGDDRLQLTYNMWVQSKSQPTLVTRYAVGTKLPIGTRVIAVMSGSSYDVGFIGTIDEATSSCPYITWDNGDRGCAVTDNLAPYGEPSNDSLKFLNTKKIEIKFL